MKNKTIARLILVFFISASSMALAQSKTLKTKAFHKIIVSPHIEVTLVEGDEESVVIENAKVSMDKINVEVEGKTLRIYLDGAKTVTKSESVGDDDWKGNRSIYNGTMVTAKITYKKLNSLSIRGEEIVKCESPIDQENFNLRIYGESKVYFNSATLDKLTVSIYGESYLEIQGGKVANQKYNAYGESEVNTLEMENGFTKITAYGESNFRVNVDERLKVTCYGETKIHYTGNPDVDKGIVIGEASIQKIG